ncbi:hypothetical protein Tco_0024912 [Tanacetum coccineum]
MDEELAQRLFEEEQAQFERDQRIARERAAEQEAKDVALIEQMEDVQAMMDADELLAQGRSSLQPREQQTTNQNSTQKLDDYLSETHGQVNLQSAEEQDGKKDYSSSKQAESSKKRPRAEHDEESVKKQKLQDDAEKEELKACLDIVQRDNIAIDVESLCNTPKNGSQRNVFPGALLHNTIAQVMRERPLTVSFEKKSWIV